MNRILEKYRDSGFKLTPQRIAIIEYLDGNTAHPSAEDIYRSIQKKFPTMSFATVYNTLEMLVDKGEVAELSIDPDKKRFDPDSTPHHHLICSGCGRIVDIYENFELELTKEKKRDFNVTGHHIEFYGICPECNCKESE